MSFLEYRDCYVWGRYHQYLETPSTGFPRPQKSQGSSRLCLPLSLQKAYFEISWALRFKILEPIIIYNITLEAFPLQRWNKSYLTMFQNTLAFDTYPQNVISWIECLWPLNVRIRLVYKAILERLLIRPSSYYWDAISWFFKKKLKEKTF